MRWLIPLIVLFIVSIAHAEAKKPNILLIYTDDQSFKTVGCYPEAWPWVKTPHIDALAKSGAVSGGVSWGVVYAVAGLHVDGTSTAWYSVDAYGRQISR
jgi:hypothetical protein